MNRRVFIVLLILITGAGSWGWLRQRAALAQAKLALATRAASATAEAPASLSATGAAERPSSELLRLRNEVTLLRRDLEAPSFPAISKQQAEEEWASIHEGLKPSQMPGFAYFTNLSHAGFATPETAFQTFNFAMRNQQKEPLNATRMKDLWDVPDDFDEPPGYNIHLGEGMGGEVGYRLVRQETIAPNQVRLTIDYETPDGGSFRREKVFVENRGRWRMKPVSVTRPKAK